MARTGARALNRFAVEREIKHQNPAVFSHYFERELPAIQLPVP